MTVLWYALWFAVAMGLLVTVHEFGHFWVARRLGIKVLRFSVGFGTKPLLSWRGKGPDSVEYWISPIPLGGYVKMLDEREGPVPPEDLARAFTRAAPWRRIVVLLAGPGFNLLFAVVVLGGLLWAGGLTRLLPVVGNVAPGSIAAQAGLVSGDHILSINGASLESRQQVRFKLLDIMSGSGLARLTVQQSGGPIREVTLDVTNAAERKHLTGPQGPVAGLGFAFWRPTRPAVLGRVLPDGPAARAGLKAGDRIVAVEGHPVKDFEDVAAQITPHPGETLKISYVRAGVERTVAVTVASVSEDGKTIGRIEADSLPTVAYPPQMLRHVSLGPLAALRHAAQQIWVMTALQARLFSRMLLGRVSLKNLGGPLSIAEYAGQSASAGVGSFMSFLVFISLELGVLNLLPIPILDGGQIVFQLIEWVKGGPLSERAQIVGQQVGIALLILLVGLALFNDITRQFS